MIVEHQVTFSVNFSALEMYVVCIAIVIDLNAIALLRNCRSNVVYWRSELTARFLTYWWLGFDNAMANLMRYGNMPSTTVRPAFRVFVVKFTLKDREKYMRFNGMQVYDRLSAHWEHASRAQSDYKLPKQHLYRYSFVVNFQSAGSKSRSRCQQNGKNRYALMLTSCWNNVDTSLPKV